MSPKAKGVGININLKVLFWSDLSLLIYFRIKTVIKVFSSKRFSVMLFSNSLLKLFWVKFR